MTFGRRLRPVLKLGALAVLACGRVLAGTVEVTVEERGAGPVTGQNVALYPVTPEIQADRLFFLNTRPAGSCTTGLSGKCQIGELKVGVYVPFLLGIADPNLSAPLGPPMVAYGTVTISKPSTTASLRIGLQRGVRIQFRVVSEKAPIPSRSRVELTSDSGETTAVPLDSAGRARITLGSGRWTAHLAGPPGGRVVAVELDAEQLTTLDVPIELRAPGSDRFVTWVLNAPCVVRGKITSTRTPPGVEVGAMLVTPGPWADSPLCGATDCAGTPLASLDPNGNFTLQVPSGTWRIAPIGESLLESTPPAIDVTCGEGEFARADFNVRERGGDRSKAVLVAQVLGPDRAPLPDVSVEAWPPTGNRDASAPVATASTGPHFEPARFTSLPAGNYLIRARKPGYRAAVVTVSDVDPEAREPRHVTIQLDKGATIDALVTDTKGVPQRGVGLEVTPNDPEGGDQDPAARLAAATEVISVPPSNDQTGHILVTGLAAGTYTVRPVPSGSVASGVVATIAAADEPSAKELVVRLEEHDVKEVFVRVLPAASLVGRPVCADGGLFPRQFEACVLGLPPGDEDELSRETCAKPVIAPGFLALSGDRNDAVGVGPLSPGSYRLGLRPRGYAQWTWALGTPDGGQAAVVQVNGTEAVDLGTIPMLCGPAIELRPRVASHDPPPDLTLAGIDAGLSRKDANGKLERRPLHADKTRERVAFRELPEGEWTLDVAIAHPHVLPAGPVHLSVPVKLERGGLVRAVVEIAAVGGAVLVEAPTGAARISGSGIAARVVLAADGRITVDGIAPSDYLVELCDDPSCARVVRRWEGVRVVRGRTTVLAAAP